MVATLFTEDRALARQVAGLGGQQQQRSMQAMQNAQNMEMNNQSMGLRASQDARANQQLGMQQKEQNQMMGLRASGEQRAAHTHKGNMQDALQDRVFKASAMTADMAGSLAFIDDPEKFEKAAAFMTSQPHFKLLDQDGSLAEVFKDQQTLKDLAPAMRGYSQLYKEGADKKEQALALQELMDKMEDRQFKRDKYQSDLNMDREKLEMQKERTQAIANKDINKVVFEAKTSLPSYEDAVGRSVGLIDKIIRHEGLSGAIGVIDAQTPTVMQSSADFEALLEQAQGGAFLQAFESLKGGGQITQIEGVKATNAMARMQQSQSEEQFIEAMLDYKEALETGLQKMRNVAAGDVSAVGASQSDFSAMGDSAMSGEIEFLGFE